MPKDLHFLQHRHKAGGASPLGVARAACFEELAGVFASSGASLEKTDDDTLTKKTYDSLLECAGLATL